MDKYIGFDVSDKKTVACLMEANKKELYQTLPTDPYEMRVWLDQQRSDPNDRLHLTFEASYQSGWLYDELLSRVDTLSVCNPSQMPWIYRSSRKTDRLDSRKLAILLQLDELPKVHMPSPTIRQWRHDIQHRRRLVENRTQIKNRLRMYLKGSGYSNPTVTKGWWTQTHLSWLREHYADHDTVQDALEMLELLDKQIQRITQRLDHRVSKTAAIVLMSIPGVGPRTAEAVVAFADDVGRFKTGKAFAAYFGLTPRIDQSGTVCRMGHISKQGPSVVRWLLGESVWRSIRKSPALRAFYERVCHGQDKRRKIAMVATARKMLMIMRAMLLTGEAFNESLVSREVSKAK